MATGDKSPYMCNTFRFIANSSVGVSLLWRRIRVFIEETYSKERMFKISFGSGVPSFATCSLIEEQFEDEERKWKRASLTGLTCS